GRRIDRDMRAVGAVAVGALAVGEAALGAEAREFAEEQRLATRRASFVLLDAHFLFGAAKALGRLFRDTRLHVFRDHDDRRAAHDDATRGKGAESFFHVFSRTMEHAANAVHRHAERIGADLREDRLEAL